MHNGDLQLTNDLSAATEDETMESLTDNTAVGAPPPSHEALAGVVNLAYVANRDQTDAKPEQRHLQNCNDQKPPVLERNHDDARNQNHRSTPATRKAPAHNAQKSLEEEKNAVNQAQNGKILNHHHNHSNHHHQIQIPDDAVINYDTARLRKSLHRGDKADMVALDVFADSTKAQEALMCVANGGAGSGGAHPQAVPVSSPLTSCSADNGTKMFEEYFIPVNTHKKFLRPDHATPSPSHHYNTHYNHRQPFDDDSDHACHHYHIYNDINRRACHHGALHHRSTFQHYHLHPSHDNDRVHYRFLRRYNCSNGNKDVHYNNGTIGYDHGIGNWVVGYNDRIVGYHHLVVCAAIGANDRYTNRERRYDDHYDGNRDTDNQPRVADAFWSLAGFRRGSVVVSFVVVSGDRYLPANKVQETIRTYVASNGGTLGSKTVDLNSIVALDATNECKLDNGDCVKSSCEWDYLSGSKSCVCLPGTTRLSATACTLPATVPPELQNDTTTSEIETTTIFIMTTGMNLNSTVDVVEMTTSNSSAVSANDTWMTTLSPVLGVSFDVSTTTESNANSSESFGTIPSIMVHSQEPAATEEPTTVISSSLANTTATATVNSTETVTTEMYSIFRDTDEDFGNSTDQSIDMNSTMLVLFNSTLMDTNETMLNVTVSSTTDFPLNSTAGLELTTLFNMTESTTLPADLANRTDTHPMFGNSTIDEMDPEVNVSNRTYSMGRNLTFMNNNTLSDDGVDVVNGTLDAWNMTANGTLLNTGNFSFSGDDDMMATEGVNMTHHGESTMDFLNETMANTTDDVFRTLCSSEEFFCSAETSHTCLKKELLCDQFEDCPGASDEENCTESCGTNFECSDGTCVMASAKCDGIRDCPNGEDEESCDTQCTDLEVMCPDSSACIKPLSLCDGIYNCRDRSDESGCVDKTLCEQSNKFYCGDKLCISSALRCDGHPDCKDGEDEVNCTCDETQFQCMNGYCVSKASGPVRCNGVLDCADGSDERGCVKVDTNGVVHVLDGSTNSWVLMCADNATLHDGHQICQEMGYSHAVSTDVMRVDANTTAWASWISSGTEGDTWSGGVVSLESCNDGAFSVKCHHFECENQTEVLFRIEREATAQSSHSEVWPYLALIYGEGSDFACHAEIVSPLWLLTTAHCLQQLPQNASLLYAQAGFAKMYNTTERHPVKSVVLHPHFSQFRSKTLPDYDLALVRLKDPLAFASHTAAACLPDDVVRPGVTCFVGSFGDGRPRVPFMKAQSIIHLPVVINELATCNNDEHYKEDVSQQMICGDGRKMKRQLCDSDIGAPLMCLSPNNIWRLAGILSYQRHCGTYRKHPSVFSNIFEMRDFIDNVTGLKSYNVTHDPLLYTLVEFPQGDDSSNATAELRSYEPDKVLGSDRNASSAVAAALYSHENIFGGNFTDVNETVSEVYKISEFVSGPNATNASAVYNATESDVETTTAAAAAATLSLDAALREIDLSESTTVSVPSTTETSTESIGSPRLMDSDASVDVGVTAVDFVSTRKLERESAEGIGPPSVVKLGMILSATLSAKRLAMECGSWDSADRNASTSNTANGTVIHAGEKRWPAIGLLTSNDGQCIASILSPHWLLTSWSCMSRSPRGSEASSWVLTLQRPVGKDPYASFNYSISAVLPSPVSNATDLALVRVQSTLELGDGIEAICLSEKKPEQGHLCVTAGWPRNQSDHTNHLSFMPVSVVPWSVCEDSNATGLRTGDGNACASFSEKENALCQLSCNHTRLLIAQL
ncbi:low-density lipoprotein receptor, putative [Ixodes scapularis]|uniref:Low-density lipoprotein receptor, putative n=1 Tax=Ixodes scapularis TaxID=6945 RepID=B7PNJ8_IXOSC|nr:low-density lipoprotein receptor, putative [Ixodes scapularis]|eukprot:XP_002435346.1 low-density lipoprotein receptor, putative [Ixodes scapularis]